MAFDLIFSCFSLLIEDENEDDSSVISESSIMVDAAEFLSALIMLSQADMEKKVALLFTLCDGDSDGFIKPIALFVLMRSIAISLFSLNSACSSWPISLLLEMSARAARQATLQCFEESSEAALSGLLSYSDFSNWFCNAPKNPQTLWIHVFDDM